MIIFAAIAVIAYACALAFMIALCVAAADGDWIIQNLLDKQEDER